MRGYQGEKNSLQSRVRKGDVKGFGLEKKVATESRLVHVKRLNREIRSMEGKDGLRRKSG